MQKAFFILALLAALAYFGWRTWQARARAGFCEKMAVCLSEHEFYDNFGSPERCPNTRRSLEGVRLYLEMGCELEMDCDTWLRCGLGENAGRQDPFAPKNTGSDFGELLPHVEGPR